MRCSFHFKPKVERFVFLGAHLFLEFCRSIVEADQMEQPMGYHTVKLSFEAFFISLGVIADGIDTYIDVAGK